MTTDLATELLKLTLQLLLLGVLGGAVSWYYSRIQSEHALRVSLLRDFASLHGRFLSLRFRFNSFHVEWPGPRNSRNHPLEEDERRQEQWRHFEEACALHGEFYGLKPLLQTQFRDVHEDLEVIHAAYQQWRRQIGANEPVLQNRKGESSEQFKQLRGTYQAVVQRMRRQV